MDSKKLLLGFRCLLVSVYNDNHIPYSAVVT